MDKDTAEKEIKGSGGGDTNNQSVPVGVEVDQSMVNQLVEFGFERELSCLALKLTLEGDSIEEAIEILTSEDGSDLQSLY